MDQSLLKDTQLGTGASALSSSSCSQTLIFVLGSVCKNKHANKISHSDSASETTRKQGNTRCHTLDLLVFPDKQFALPY